jgi:hypothetical protein
LFNGGGDSALFGAYMPSLARFAPRAVGEIHQDDGGNYGQPANHEDYQEFVAHAGVSKLNDI